MDTLGQGMPGGYDQEKAAAPNHHESRRMRVSRQDDLHFSVLTANETTPYL